MTIGVFLAYLNDSYQRFLWRFILQRAKERGIAVVGFCGHGLGYPSLSHATMNLVYRMAKAPALDGLVVFANTLGTFHGPNAVKDLMHGQNLPAISIGFDLADQPCVFARGAEAMEELVRHLITVHGRRKLALVTGPQGHLESMERETAFRKVLAEHAIAFSPQLQFQGQFYKESGTLAVQAFLESGLPFDAVVCLNDHMAIGALEALRGAGIRVPLEVSVTGFDDIEEADWVSPPLTTIRQPMAELAYAAFDMTVDHINGKAVHSKGLDCQFVQRQSCGCPPVLPLPALAQTYLVTPDCINIQDIKAVKHSVSLGDSKGLLASLGNSLSKQWGNQAMLQFWREQILELKRSQVDATSAPGWADQAIAWLAEEELRWEREFRLNREERAENIREFTVRLLGLLELEAIVRYGEDHFNSLGIPRAFLVLFPEPGNAQREDAPIQAAWITTSLNPDRSMTKIPFETSKLIPPLANFVWGTHGWLVEPLVYQDEFLGYLLLECGNADQMAFEASRETFSTAVKGARLINEVQDHRKHLENQVRSRTRELEIANQDLQEVSNRTMQAIGQDIHDDLCQHLVGIAMLASVVEESLANQQPVNLPAIREIRELLDLAVLRSRQFARSLYPAGLVEHGLAATMEDLIGTMRRTVPNVTISLSVEGQTREADPVQAYQLYRIIQECLSNALRHSGSDIILVRIVSDATGLLAEVRDFGTGLASQAIGSGMGTRIMRHRAQAIGARLETYNLDPGVCVSCILPWSGGLN